MKFVQLGSNVGNDNLFKYLENSNQEIEFGLLVEANLLHIENLKKCYKLYPNVIVENVAIKPPSHLEDTLKFFYCTTDGPLYESTSCRIEHIQKHLEMCPHLSGGEIKTFEVSCVTIETLFDNHNITELDWLLIDVEGIDAELLLSTDWSKYNIKKFEFENIHFQEIEKRNIEKMLHEFGYIRTTPLNPFDEAWIKKTEVNKMNITLYAICKNEEKNVEKFIQNSKKFSHTIVVDTGSTDNTVALLREAGIEVHEHSQSEKEFDFSQARNQALSYVKTDWAFSLDFNEDISDFYPEGIDIIADEFTTFKHLRFDIIDDNEPIQSNEVHVRFHRTKNYIWRNAVHEIPEFVPTELFLNEIAVDTTIKITKTFHKSVCKQLFYLSICEREYERDNTNWYYLWFIFHHYESVKNHEKCLEYGKQFLNISIPYQNQFRVKCFITCSKILIEFKRIKEAANYAFHALSEAMNFGGDILGNAFIHLLNIGVLTQNPNIVIFASAFSDITNNLDIRKDAIQTLYNSIESK